MEGGRCRLHGSTVEGQGVVTAQNVLKKQVSGEVRKTRDRQ